MGTGVHLKLENWDAVTMKKDFVIGSEARSFLQATLDATADGIIIIDCRQKNYFYNRKFIDMWNIDAKTLQAKDQRNLWLLLLKKLKYPKAYFVKERKLYAQSEGEDHDVFELKDGRFFERYSKPQWVDGKIIGRVLSFRDVTDNKRIETGMAHLERMNLIGEMAAGIGHEVRNPMTTIRGFLQMLTKKQECSQYREYYKLMIGELDRANSIITEFLSLAKEGVVQQQLKNMNQIITSLLPLIQADAIIDNKNVTVELGEIPDIILDEQEIRQLILNLVRNSLDAMLPGSNLTIKTYLEGEKVVLAVKDQGTGIDATVLKDIAKPFFTTKKQGTGLGLAICYNIAARHNATVDVETSDKGTTFLIRFCKTNPPQKNVYMV